MNHDEACLLVADAGAERLPEPVRLAFDSHAATCPECRAALEAYRFLAQGLVAAPPADHPASDLLARIALVPARLWPEDGAGLVAHLAACAECARSVDDARAAAAPAPSGAAASPWWRRAALAASVVLALGAVSLARWRPAGERSAWSGSAGYLLLGGMERGQDAVPALDLAPGQPAALLAVSLDAGALAETSARIAFRVRAEGGADVWRLEMPAAEVLRWVEGHGAVLLYLPRTATPPGRYVLEAGARREDGRDEALLTRRFEVRSSP